MIDRLMDTESSWMFLYTIFGRPHFFYFPCQEIETRTNASTFCIYQACYSPS